MRSYPRACAGCGHIISSRKCDAKIKASSAISVRLCVVRYGWVKLGAEFREEGKLGVAVRWVRNVLRELLLPWPHISTTCLMTASRTDTYMLSIASSRWMFSRMTVLKFCPLLTWQSCKLVITSSTGDVYFIPVQRNKYRSCANFCAALLLLHLQIVCIIDMTRYNAVTKNAT